jgi:hypothetical protein
MLQNEESGQAPLRHKIRFCTSNTTFNARRARPNAVRPEVPQVRGLAANYLYSSDPSLGMSTLPVQ